MYIVLRCSLIITIRSGRIISHKTARPLQMDVSIVFARWRQCALPCGHIGTTWRIRIELVLPSAHPSPQPKRQINQFSCFCAARGRKSLYFTVGTPFPQNCCLSWGDLHPHQIHDSLGQSKQQSKRHHDLFSCFHTGDRTVSYTLQFGHSFPP